MDLEMVVFSTGDAETQLRDHGVEFGQLSRSMDGLADFLRNVEE